MAKANTHMTHLENLVIYGGVSGTRQAIFALRGMRDMLKGTAKKSYNTTIKIDGSPAVFAGWHPETNRFFVAKKGLFNKNPQFFHTEAEIDAEITGDLAVKMKAALVNLRNGSIPKGEIWQGDIMYTSDSLGKDTIDGETYVTFHPNTIVYAVPIKSELGKKILKSNIGIAFHTRYTGNDLASLQAHFGISDKLIKKAEHSGLWCMSTNVDNLSGTVTLTKDEMKVVDAGISKAGKIFSSIAGSTIRAVESNPKLAQTIEQYDNKFIRDGVKAVKPAKFVDGLIKFIEDKYTKEIDKLKTEKGKSRKRAAMEEFLSFFSDDNKKNLIKMIELMQQIATVKLIIINKLSKLNSMSTFLKTKDGYKVTGQEGFVAIDTLSGDGVKLVDRLGFSYANFSPEIIKGWDSASRG